MQFKEGKIEGEKLLKSYKKENFRLLDVVNGWALFFVKNHEGWKIANQRNFANGIARWCIGATKPFEDQDGKIHPGKDYYTSHKLRGDAYLLLVKIKEEENIPEVDEDGVEILGTEEPDPAPDYWDLSYGKWGVKYLIAFRPNGDLNIISQDNVDYLGSSEKLFGFNVADYRDTAINLEKNEADSCGYFGTKANLKTWEGIEGTENLSERAKHMLSQLIVEAGFPQKVDLVKLIETSDLNDSSKLSLLTELESKLTI